MVTKATRDSVDLNVRTVLALNVDPTCTVKLGGTLWNNQVLSTNPAGTVNALAYSQNIAIANTLVQRTSAGELVGTASSARYADLAERYEIDTATHQPGMVVTIGGDKEIRVAEAGDVPLGVLSTNPAFKMNADAGDDLTHPYVALVGRVPCQVYGAIARGDELVVTGGGIAMKASWWQRTFSRQLIFAQAMGTSDGTSSFAVSIEVVLK